MKIRRIANALFVGLIGSILVLGATSSAAYADDVG